MGSHMMDIMSDASQEKIISDLTKGKSVIVISDSGKAALFRDLFQAKLRKDGINYSSAPSRELCFVGERGGMLRVLGDKRLLQGMHPQRVYSDDAETVKWAAPYVRS